MPFEGVSAGSFLRLQPGRDPFRWSADVDAGVVVGNPAQQTLYGGAGLGLALQAMEQAIGRPVICATAQFLTFAYRGEKLDIEVAAAKSGFQITQAQAFVRRGSEGILTVTAALGSRPGKVERQWAAAGSSPPPQDCAPIVYHWRRDEGDMHGRLDVRVVQEPDWDAHEGGGACYWVRARERTPIDSGFLAVLGDFVPTALGATIGPSRMSSLDNTLRIIGAAHGEWILCRTRFFRMGQGLAHGAMQMFDETGAMIASASQSFIVRH